MQILRLKVEVFVAGSRQCTHYWIPPLPSMAQAIAELDNNHDKSRWIKSVMEGVMTAVYAPAASSQPALADVVH